jgi:3-hydroxy-D-aspartate aldolase
MQAYAATLRTSSVRGARKRLRKTKMGKAVETVPGDPQEGHRAPRLTGGSTGTYNIDCNIDGVTELQPGSFMFMDVDYNRIGGSDGKEFYGDFQNSTHRVTTVVSKPSDQLAIVDGGLKAFSTDKPFPPRIKDSSAVTYAFGGDETASSPSAAGAKALQVGDKAEFVIRTATPR